MHHKAVNLIGATNQCIYLFFHQTYYEHFCIVYSKEWIQKEKETKMQRWTAYAKEEKLMQVLKFKASLSNKKG